MLGPSDLQRTAPIVRVDPAPYNKIWHMTYAMLNVREGDSSSLSTREKSFLLASQERPQPCQN